MKNDRWLVRWQDGTYDWQRKCDECQSDTCKYPVHRDRYDEIGSVKDPSPDYWEWMNLNDPLGHSVNALGEKQFTEFFDANPDGLCCHHAVPKDCDFCKSGMGDLDKVPTASEIQHTILREAFAQLTDKQQEVWQLVMREQMSLTDAAAQLGITKQSADNRLNAAKLKFTEYLRSQEHRVSA